MPREATGVKGEPLTVKALHDIGRKNFEQTKIINYAEVLPADLGVKNHPDTFMACQDMING